jgi:hypothetical protein
MNKDSKLIEISTSTGSVRFDPLRFCMSTDHKYMVKTGTSGRRRNTYSGDFKVKVVLEFIKGEKNLNDLANQYELHPNQIKNWKSIFLKQAGKILDDKRRNNGKRSRHAPYSAGRRLK